MSAPRAKEPQIVHLPRWTRVVDAITVGLIVIAILAIFHPIRTSLFGVPIRVNRWWRLLIVAAAFTAGRHWMLPAPTLRSRLVPLWERLLALAPPFTGAVIIAAVTRILVLLIGYFAVITVGLTPDAPLTMGWRAGPELPLRWDAGWYLGIVSNGYQWSGSVLDQQNLNFFPAYPMLVRLVSWGIHLDTVPQATVESWTATMVSMAAFLAACIYLHRLVAARFDQEIASGTVVAIATYPFALFFSAVYPEALFLLCVVGAWYHLEREQRIPALLWGLAAGLCRPNGGLLTIALSTLVVLEHRRKWTLYLVALGPIIGTLLYSAWAYHLTGHPFVWAEIQRTAFERTYRSLDETIWVPLTTMVDRGLISYMRIAPWQVINLMAALLAMIALWPIVRRIGLAAGVFVAINLFVPLLNGGLVSMGRYSSVLFPVFIWLAVLARGQSLVLLAACFALLQGVFAVLFFTWRPVF